MAFSRTLYPGNFQAIFSHCFDYLNVCLLFVCLLVLVSWLFICLFFVVVFSGDSVV